PQQRKQRGGGNRLDQIACNVERGNRRAELRKQQKQPHRKDVRQIIPDPSAALLELLIRRRVLVHSVFLRESVTSPSGFPLAEQGETRGVSVNEVTAAHLPDLSFCDARGNRSPGHGPAGGRA